MKNTIIKLISFAVLTVIALVAVVSVSYAWISMSTSPEISGLQVKIGAVNTIMVAPNITKTTDGATLNYPGKFSDSLNFANTEGYGYLNSMVSLAPVSTSDGNYWYFPSNDSDSGYICDSTLQYANLSELPSDNAVQGGYACLDFWVVSPTYASLRVSVGEGEGGSYVLSLPQPVKNGDGYSLDMSKQLLAGCTRVGFLANTQQVTDMSMNDYVHTAHYNTDYRSLKGVYQNKNESPNSYPAVFTIYEPNGDLHSKDGAYALSRDGFSYVVCQNGSYAVTKPISASETGLPAPVDATAHTTVQKTTSWLAATESQLLVEQMFGTYLYGINGSRTPEELSLGFYNGYLGYQCSPYITKGEFIKNTSNLLAKADIDGLVKDLSTLETAGATTDIVIAELEKNVPQRIRMFVWIEGQDIDCDAASDGGQLLINLELAASTK